MKNFVLFIFILVLVRCDKVENDLDRIVINSVEYIEGKKQMEFHSFFAQHRFIDLNFDNDSIVPPPNISHLLINDRGQIIIPNAYEKEIYVLDSLGVFLTKIGREGRGPGEFETIKKIRLDQEHNLWVYDIAQSRFTIFKPKDYIEYQIFNIEKIISDFIPISSESYIAYTPLENYVIHQMSLNNDIIDRSYSIENESLRIFLGRYQNGGFHVNNEGSIYFVYPGSFEIRKYNNQMTQVASFISNVENKNSIFSSPPEFPSNLDPFDFTRLHQDWWFSFYHIDNVLSLNEDKILIQSYKATMGGNEYYISLIDKKGQVLFQDILIPESGRIAAVYDKKIYIVYPERMLSSKKIEYLRLYEYGIIPEL